MKNFKIIISFLNNQEKENYSFSLLMFLNIGFEILSISMIIPLINLIVSDSSDFYGGISF